MVFGGMGGEVLRLAAHHALLGGLGVIGGPKRAMFCPPEATVRVAVVPAWFV